MSSPYCYQYPRPAVTTDLVVFAWIDDSLQTLLVRREQEPFAGRWAIPGGFLDMDETAEAGARRELQEEAGLIIPGAVDPLGFFAAPERDPRGRTITLAHVAILPAGDHPVAGGDDAVEAAWRPIAQARDLAFDHAEILNAAKEWLRRKIATQPTESASLLPRPIEPHAALALFRCLGLSAERARTWLKSVGSP